MDLTTEAVRLAMGMARVRAEVASANIASADLPGSPVQRADFGVALGLLRQAAAQPEMDADRLRMVTPATLHASVHADLAVTNASSGLESAVAELETAGADFQTLATVQSRRFALMQLAMSGGN